MKTIFFILLLLAGFARAQVIDIKVPDPYGNYVFESYFRFENRKLSN